MEMASSEVEFSSCQSFNSVLSPHERCIRGDNKKKNKNNNVRNIHVAFEKNLNVFVKDHLENCSVSDDSTKEVHERSSNKSSVSDHRLSKTEESRHEVPSSSSLRPDPDSNFSNPGQPDKISSRNETMAASSLVQIWEARTTPQPPSSNQNLSQSDSRTSSYGSNNLDNTESLSEESVKEFEFIQPIEEGNNEEEDEEEEKMECDSQFVAPPTDSGGKEIEGGRVMDIIRKLSNDSEFLSNNDNGSNNIDNTKEVHTTEAKCFPQVACSRRIRGRQAFADLLVQMKRDREKELAFLLDRHSVSKFTQRGRIQSTLKIRCYERCIAIQGSHRSKSSSAASDLNRSPRGSGVMHLLREKYKTNSENNENGASSSSVSSRGRLLEKDPNKAAEKKVLQETMEKIDIKETHEVISAVENVKKAVLSDIAENKSGLKKSTGETIHKETAEGRGKKTEVKEKSVAKESLEKIGERLKTKEKAVVKESVEGRDEKREMKDKLVAKESLERIGERRESKEKDVAKESLEGRGEKRNLTKEKAIAKESVEGNGITEKVNLWNSDEKINKRKETEKGKIERRGNTEIVEKNDVLEEATRRIINVESAERSITTSKETMTRCEFVEKVVRRKKKEDCVYVETNSKEIEDRNINPREATIQADSLCKPASDEKALQETIAKSDLKKPIEKESRVGRDEKMEEGAEENTLGIAEKVNLWNSKEQTNRRRDMEKGKGKTEGKANTETNELLQEASRRLINVETAERSITTSSKEMMEKVVGEKEIMDRSESSTETTRSESDEKGRKKKDGDFTPVEAKSKEILEVKNMNHQEVKPVEESATHSSLERCKEINYSQDGEEMPIPRNSEAKSTNGFVRNNFQENITEEESASDNCRESGKEKNSSFEDKEMSNSGNLNDQNAIKESEDEETKKVECEEKDKNVKEKAIDFVYEWDENEMEEEEYGYYDHYIGDNIYDWFSEISRPRSYWEDLRKQRYLEVLNSQSEKKDICNLIESRTVSKFLTSDLREKIDNLMITRGQSHLGVHINQKEEEEDNEEEEEWVEECSARNQEDSKTEEESEKTNLEAASDGCIQSSARSSSTLKMSCSVRDQDIVKDNEPTTSLSLPEPSVPTNQSTHEMQTISDLRGQMEQLQREMLELRNSVKSCIDMQLHLQKSVTDDLSRSDSSAEQRVETRKDPLKRKCCVCLEMPVDSLLYRCGHMCTCLKCAHELQWSSKKCPICMAPIVDVVRAFLDS